MANDFSSDTDCKAVWNLDNGALVTDSQGTNTLTNNGVSADTGDFKQGDASGVFVPLDSMVRVDADLDAGFPLKNGDANKKISTACWVKLTSLPTTNSFQTILSKWDSGGNQRSYAVFVRDQSGTPSFTIAIGYSGGASTEFLDDTSMTPVTGRWYHIATTFQDSDKSWRIRIWDDTGSSVTETTGTSTNNINVETAAFLLGQLASGGLNLDAKLDEVVIFSDILSPSEIDDIRNGVFGAGPSLEVSCDAVLLATVTHEITCDAILAKVHTITCDAVLVAKQTHTVTCDAVLVLGASAQITCDATLINRLSITCDANLADAPVPSWPEARPVGYDEELLWDEDTKSWYAPDNSIGVERTKQAGGRYRTQIVTISDKGRIYFGNI